MDDKLATHDRLVRGHINDVRANLAKLIAELDRRGQVHDASKLEEPERSIYAEAFPKLAQTEYGTPAYNELLQEVKPAIDHHYSKNTHHPEHWPNGVNDMDLMDVVEMLADWAASTKKNKNGNIHRSIEHNTARFKLSPQLAQILTNTVNRYF